MPPRRPIDREQGLLFGDGPIERALAAVPPAGARSDLVELGRSLPPSVRLGTSSWAFPGWRGIVYGPSARAADLARCGIAAYAQHPLHRTVGLDRAFYSLLGAPEARELAELVPSGFRFLVKAHQSVTRPDADPSGATFGDTARWRAEGIDNPRFLDAAFARDAIVAPLVEGLGDRLGPIVFQFPPSVGGPGDRPDDARAFIDRLHRFLGALPRGPLYAVELRSRPIYAPSVAAPFAAALRDCRVAHGFAVHPTLPSLAEQAAILAAHGWPIERQPALSIRWLLGHGQGYDEAKLRYEPFASLVDPDPVRRDEVSQLIERALDAGRLAWVIANNKAEGSAPLTLEQLVWNLLRRGSRGLGRGAGDGPAHDPTAERGGLLGPDATGR